MFTTMLQVKSALIYRYFEFSGFGSLNKNWTYHHKYNTKRHGQVVVTGELNGNFGEISFPDTAF